MKTILSLGADPNVPNAAKILVSVSFTLIITWMFILATRRHAARQYSICLAGIVTSLLIPVVIVACGRWEVAIVEFTLPERPSRNSVFLAKGMPNDGQDRLHAGGGESLGDVADSSAGRAVNDMPHGESAEVLQKAVRDPNSRWSIAILTIWLAGSIYVAMKFVLGFIYVRRIRFAPSLTTRIA